MSKHISKAHNILRKRTLAELMDTIWKIYNSTGLICSASKQCKRSARCSCVTGMKITKLTIYAQFWFTWGSEADKINAATPFRATEILDLSKYTVYPILPLNDMYSLLSSNSLLIPQRVHLLTSMELCQFIHAQMLISVREYSIQWHKEIQTALLG